jgi:protein tyrosine phosphatase
LIVQHFAFQGSQHSQEFIAAQGPMPNTSHDFWRMVLQDNSEFIVMLTGLIENNKLKCHKYFPSIGSKIQFDEIIISCLSENTHNNFVKRIFEIQKVCQVVGDF